MKLPKRVKIGHVTYRIVPLEDPDRAPVVYGLYMGNDCIIKIDVTRDTQIVRDTLLHEIMHGIWQLYAIDDEDLQERTICTMATGLTQVFADNPKIGKFLMG